MLHHQGTTILETERLILRRFTMDDTEDMFNNWANDPEVTKYLDWSPHGNIDKTKEILISWINQYENPEVYNWAIVPKDYGKVIGSISVVNLSGEPKRCEIGYCMSKAYWNQGIMTESLKKVIHYLIDEVGFHRISATHKVNNPASGRVMVKAGMTYEGRLRKYNIDNAGQYFDCDLYAILEEDLAKNPS